MSLNGGPAADREIRHDGWKKAGAELPALLLRRAPVQEMQEALGNGTAAHEGSPFSLGCFLRSPGDFAEGGPAGGPPRWDARAVGAMAARCAAPTSGVGIPEHFLARLPGRRNRGNGGGCSRWRAATGRTWYSINNYGCVASEAAPFVARRAVNLHGCALPHFAPLLRRLRRIYGLKHQVGVSAARFPSR